MGDYEDAILALREADLDEQADVFESYGATALRKKAGRTDELTRENEDLQKRLKSLEQGPKVEEAFRKAGVDFEALRPADREVITRTAVEDLNDQAVADLIAKYELPVVEGNEEQGDEEPAAAGVVSAARQAPQGQASGTTLKPEDVAEWPVDKLQRLLKQHPEEFESLKRGETVTGIAFS